MELEKFPIDSLCVETASAFLFPTKVDQISTKLKKYLVSKDRAESISAFKAMDILMKSNNKIICTELTGTLGECINWGKRAGLTSALNIVFNLLQEHADLFNESLEGDLLIGIDKLALDTDLLQNNDDWSFYDRLQVREAASRVAFALDQYYSRPINPPPKKPANGRKFQNQILNSLKFGGHGIMSKKLIICKGQMNKVRFSSEYEHTS